MKSTLGEKTAILYSLNEPIFHPFPYKMWRTIYRRNKVGLTRMVTCLAGSSCCDGRDILLVNQLFVSLFINSLVRPSYNTRSRDLLRPPFAKTTKYQGSFRINGAWTYNTLPRIIRQGETLSEFKIKLKRHFKQ